MSMLGFLWTATVLLIISQIVAIVRCFLSLSIWTLVWTTVVFAGCAVGDIVFLLAAPASVTSSTKGPSTAALSVVLMIIMLLVNLRAHTVASREW